MPTVEECLASLEARSDSMNDLKTSIAALRTDMNRQFTEVREDMNRQFISVREDMNRQFLDVRGDTKVLDQKVDSHFMYLVQKTDRQFTWLVGTQLALLLAVVGALVGAYYRYTIRTTPTVRTRRTGPR